MDSEATADSAKNKHHISLVTLLTAETQRSLASHNHKQNPVQ